MLCIGNNTDYMCRLLGCWTAHAGMINANGRAEMVCMFWSMLYRVCAVGGHAYMWQCSHSRGLTVTACQCSGVRYSRSLSSQASGLMLTMYSFLRLSALLRTEPLMKRFCTSKKYRVRQGGLSFAARCRCQRYSVHASWCQLLVL